MNTKRPLRDMMAGLFSRRRIAKATVLSRSVIDHPAISEYRCEDLAERSPVWERSLALTPDLRDPNGDLTHYTQMPELTRDLFYAYHEMGDRAELLPAEQVKPSHELHRKLMGSFMEQPAFQASRPYTRDDPLTSAMTAISAQQELIAMLENELAEDAKRAQDMADTEGRIGEHEDDLSGLREQANQLTAQGKEVPEKLKDDIKLAAEHKRHERERLDDLAKGVSNATPERVEKAAQAAAESAQEKVQQFLSLPGNGIGERKAMRPDEAIKLATKWSENTYAQQVAAMLGRLQTNFRFVHANRVPSSRGVPVDVTVGNDLTHMLPSERMLLAAPESRPLFYQRYLDRTMLQYRVEGDDDAGLGPFIAMLDLSYSMKDRNKHIFAKAATLALLSVAHRDRRDVLVLPFNGGQMGEFAFMGGNVNLDLAYDFACMAPSGGTVPYSTMLRAFNWMDTRSEFSRSDLVIITDGDANFGEEDLKLAGEMREVHGARIHGFSIEVRTTAYLEAVCDRVVHVSDLNGPSEATDALVRAIA